jgi:ferredoxin
LNELCDSNRDAFDVAEVTEHTPPTPEQVAANQAKWGL